MLQRFTNKIAVVTGGAQGIGRATAERLGREGGAIFIARPRPLMRRRRP
jgi:dihydroxycyclohexadiene carboxylate dehydrogenase